MMRKDNLVTGEFYHLYNRGVDKRNVIEDKHDLIRFFQSIKEFNTIEPIGSIFENSFKQNMSNGELGRLTSKLQLVNIVAYCINPNHFHIVVKQTTDNGISEFMKRLGGGYTKYFNNKYKRSGSLFQGTFKSKLIDTNEYLLRVSTYVSLNNKIKGNFPILSMASWDEYIGKNDGDVCSKDLILDQFNNVNEYKVFALDTLEDIKSNKIKFKEIEDLIA